MQTGDNAIVFCFFFFVGVANYRDLNRSENNNNKSKQKIYD